MISFCHHSQQRQHQHAFPFLIFFFCNLSPIFHLLFYYIQEKDSTFFFIRHNNFSTLFFKNSFWLSSNLPVQCLGSSLPSSQSALPSQYLSKGIQILVLPLHGYSETLQAITIVIVSCTKMSQQQHKIHLLVRYIWKKREKRKWNWNILTNNQIQ